MSDIRKFEVLKVREKKIVGELRKKKNEDGTVQAYMVYHEVRRGEKNPLNKEIFSPKAYGHSDINVGDTIEFDITDDQQRRFADKCASNPDFREIKPGRPKKDKAA